MRRGQSLFSYGKTEGVGLVLTFVAISVVTLVVALILGRIHPGAVAPVVIAIAVLMYAAFRVWVYRRARRRDG